MFGLGMNNNGAGLVLASVALADHPQVMLPIIVYNLVQHLAAGAVAYFLARTTVGWEEPGLPPPRPALRPNGSVPASMPDDPSPMSLEKRHEMDYPRACES